MTADDDTGDSGGIRAADVDGIAVIGVFLNREIIVDHYKTISEGINSNQLINDLADGGRAVVVAKKKSGFTRQLLIGPLDAQPFEYTPADWKVTTQNYQHLPDLMEKRRPSVIIVVGEDVTLLLAVLATVYNSGRKFSDTDAKRVVDSAKNNLRMGDVVLYRRDGYTEDDPDGIFQILYSLGGD